MKKYLTLMVCAIMLCTFFSNKLSAQFTHFSQASNQTLWLNSGLTGKQTDYSNIALTYRYQWASVPAPYHSYMLSFDAPIVSENEDKLYHFGWGSLVHGHDSDDGVLSEKTAAVSFAFHQKIFKQMNISIGGQLAYNNSVANFSKIVFPEQIVNYQIDPTLISNMPNGTSKFSHFHTQLGLVLDAQMARHSGYAFGISYNHLFKPKTTFLSEIGEQFYFASYWTTFMEYTMGIGNKISITPSLVMVSPDSVDFNLSGLSVAYHLGKNDLGSEKIYLGAWYREYGNIVLLVGLDKTDFTLNASYDMNFSDLNTASNGQGALEISFIYRFLTNR